MYLSSHSFVFSGNFSPHLHYLSNPFSRGGCDEIKDAQAPSLGVLHMRRARAAKKVTGKALVTKTYQNSREPNFHHRGNLVYCPSPSQRHKSTPYMLLHATKGRPVFEQSLGSRGGMRLLRKTTFFLFQNNPGPPPPPLFSLATGRSIFPHPNDEPFPTIDQVDFSRK